MAALSDHVRRDADSASLAEINLMLNPIKRRAYEAAKTSNKQTIEGLPEGLSLPFGYGTKVGRLTALNSLREFLSDLDDDIKRAALALEEGEKS